ncbi:cupin-like domain-containing protein [Pyxidicoccus parkwayensis]|uniref:Cupin-like domain-containing protein n=1 Tax=Pyxidicoccus parkwayensis TaxID=2813578 RepID=A0ABX7NWL7_9BACT|nr:cupin domain-containing protein [Pyxidicoccus parkwaysis]QSQ21784.1 cupin-like domain-containing protein [Pyxidicoccus parkwaysis]
MLAGTGHELAQLLHPVTPEEFLAKYWEKQALHVRGTPEKFARLFDRKRFDQAILHAGFDKRAPASFGIHAFWRNRHGLYAAIEIAPDQVREALTSRTTVCVNDIGAGDEGLSVFAAHIKRQLGLPSPVRFNCYLSPPGEGLDTHYDARHATVIQLSGRKLWRYSRLPAAAYPLRNAIVEQDGRVRQSDNKPIKDVPTPDESQFEEVMLEPGDILYLPPGCWHNAKAGDDSSLALNMACETVGFFSILGPELERVLQNRVEWRSLVPATLATPAGAGAMPPEVKEFISSRVSELRELLGKLAADEAELERLWRRSSTSSPHFTQARPASEVSLKPGDVLQRTEPYPLPFVVRPDAKADAPAAVYVYGANTEVALPGDALPLVRALAERQRFTVSEVESWPGVRLEQAHDVLKLLVTRGLLRTES